MALVRKAPQARRTAPAPTDEPYAGFIDVPAGAVIQDENNEHCQAGDLARTEPHLLVTGATGKGKTRSVLGPNIIRWGARPVVAMSAKGDMAELTIRKRATRGPVYLMDLSGEVRESELQGVPVTRVRCDPCASITSDDEALDLADLLMETGALGSGDTGGGGGDAAFWKTLARRRLACFLLAGGWYPDPGQNGKLVWGGGVAWALNACETIGPDAAPPTGGTGITREGLDPDEVPEEDAGVPEDQPVDLQTPNWSTAYLRCLLLDSWHAPSLLAAREMDPKQRDSIGINCQVAMSAWSLRSVANDHPAFDPAMLAADPGATLYLVSPAEGGAAPAASLTLVQIVNYWRHRVGQLRPVLFVLDEVTNGSPIPAKRFLNQWVGTGRSLNIRLCCAAQNTDQFGLLWGNDHALRVLRNTFPAILVMLGANEQELLERAAKSALPEERVTASVDASGKASHSRERVQSIEMADLIPRRRSEGRLLLSGMQGVKVRLPDISKTDLLD